MRRALIKALHYGRLHGWSALIRKIRIRFGDLGDFLSVHPKPRLVGGRDTILVVSHEASRTGAPILALNLVQRLMERYNVVVLLLGAGELRANFYRTGAMVTTAGHLRIAPALARFLVNRLCRNVRFKFALVNSVESAVILPALRKNSVRTVTLIHEFASYTRPRRVFEDALKWSDELVFSTKLTWESALHEYPDLTGRSAHIVPQGRCVVPPRNESMEQYNNERIHISRLMRSKASENDSVIILGAGSVILRKGVDKFIECAAHVVRAHSGRKCRFIWIGNGFSPDTDIGYSVYLADQIHRAELQGYVSFIEETAAIEAAYEEADLFLLSSRLDPLPNVAIDALGMGVPVLCFDKATGIADFLNENGLGDYCIAEYLDSSDMAKKILALVASPILRSQIGDRSREASMAYFDMASYVSKMVGIAQFDNMLKKTSEVKITSYS